MTEYIYASDAIFRRDQPDAISGELIYDEVDGVNGQRIISLLETVDGLRAEITAERQASEREVAAIKGIIKEREYSAWLQGECDKAVDALYKCNAEVAALRAQLHTEIEQRQFVGDLITNMPHARLAAEFEEFKAEVAAANLREEPHAQPCPCAWCRLERDNQGEQ